MNLLIDSLDLVAAVIAILFITKLAFDSNLGAKGENSSVLLANSIKRSLLNQIVIPRT